MTNTNKLSGGKNLLLLIFCIIILSYSFYVGMLLWGLFVLSFIPWLWMLIDCLKRPDDKFAIGENYAKLIWVLVIVFTGLIGALLYYFLIKRNETSIGR